ncbi:MAG: O-antigen ligase family protein [Candidatus Firestonebacteria bacterium]
MSGYKKIELYFDNIIKTLLCLFFLTCAVSISLSEIGFFGAFFAWIIKMAYLRKLEWKKSPADLPLIAFTILTLIAVFIGVDKAGELTNRFKPLSLMLVYPLIVNNLKSRKSAKEFLLIILCSVLLQSIIIIYKGLTTLNLSLGIGVGGTMSVTLTAGEIIATTLGFTLCFLAASKDKKIKYFSMITLFAGISALLFTLARGAWVSFISVAVIFTLAWNKKIFFLVLAVIILLSTGVFYMKGNVFFRKIESTFDMTHGTTPVRFAMWRSGFLMLKDNPLGLGIDNVYKNSEKPAYKLTDPKYPNFGHLHNNYLQIAVERGVFALGAFLWLFFVFIRTSLIGYFKEEDKEIKFAFLGLFLAFSAFMVSGMFEYSLGSAIYAPIIWALAGIVMTIGNERLSEVIT